MQAEECRCGGGWEQGSKLNEESKERKRPEVKRVAGRVGGRAGGGRNAR